MAKAPQKPISELRDHVIIAGYGVPGRAVADWYRKQGMPLVIIELNGQIVDRCSRTGVPIIVGDVQDESKLKEAGIERAAVFALAVPVESVVLNAIPIARKLNPNVHIIARCNFISNGMEALKRGVNETVIEEEIAAREFVRLLEAAKNSAAQATSK